MFFVKDSISVTVFLRDSDVQTRDKTTASTLSSKTSCILLITQIILSFLASPSTASGIASQPTSSSNVSATLHSLQEHCRTKPEREVNVSLLASWLPIRTDICIDLTWFDVMLPKVNRISNSSLAINCSELNHISNTLKNILMSFEDFSSAVGRFDCSQKFSTKTNCSKCLVSAVSRLQLATSFELHTPSSTVPSFQVEASHHPFKPKNS